MEKALLAIASTGTQLAGFAKLERVLAALCILNPILLIMADGWHVRGSISAYYSMNEAQCFYLPLSIAAMLFICNGVLQGARAYNTLLGTALMGVLAFNHDDWTTMHNTCAIAFFGGSAAVIVIYSPVDELRFKWSLVAVIAASIAAWLSGYISLFAAEWISLAIIGMHYILESRGVIG